MPTSIALVLALLPQSAATPDLAAELSPLGRAFRDEHALDGLSLVVDVGGETVFAGGFGWSDAKARHAADERSTYAAPGLADVWTTLLVLRRVDDDALALDDPLAKHLPVAKELDASEDLTLGRLLAHVSGLADPEELSERPGDPAALARAVLAAPRTNAPGACRADNPADTALLALALEHATGRPVATLAREELLDPLALEHTAPCAADEPPDALEPCTTARDLLRFQRALAAGELVSDRGVEHMLEETRLTDGSGTGHGLGVDLRPLDDEPCWSYGSDPDGTRMLVAAYPRFDLTVVLLCTEPAPLERLERSIARTVLGRRGAEIESRPLDPDRANAYVGRYSVGCLQIDVERSEAGLVLYPPFGVPHELAWQGGDEFVAVDDPDVRVRFTVESDRAEVLILDDHGTRTEARRG